MSSRILSRNPTLPRVEAQNSRNAERLAEMADKILLGQKRLSYSSFAHFIQSPDDFIRYKLDKDDKSTKAMDEGKVFHTLVLEPHKFHDEYALEFEGKTPSGANQIKFADGIQSGLDQTEAYVNSYSTKGKSDTKIRDEAKELYDSLSDYMQWLISIGKRTVISHKTYEHCYRCAEAVLENEVAWSILQPVFEYGGSEKGVQWEHMGYQWHGYLDGYCPAHIADLKKCTDAHPQKVRRQIAFDGWGEQSALYSIATDSFNIPYYIIAVDNNYQVSVTEIPKGARIEKIQHLNWYINRFTECLVNPSKFYSSFDFYTPATGGIYKY